MLNALKQTKKACNKDKLKGSSALQQPWRRSNDDTTLANFPYEAMVRRDSQRCQPKSWQTLLIASNGAKYDYNHVL